MKRLYPGWRPYPATVASTVTGTLLVSDPIEAPALDRSVELLAWLPTGHAGRTDHRVLYMHDGQNLFDEVTSNTGEWRVDETLSAMSTDVIVVGIPNAGERRDSEYCPWPGWCTSEARGAAYAGFVVESVIPFVNETLPVDPARPATGVMGSSLGGLISLYLFLTYPERFGFVGSMSTAAAYIPEFWDLLERTPLPEGRVYVDAGTNEEPNDPAAGRAYLDTFHRLVAWCRSRRPGDEDLLWVEEEGAIHRESAWARRLPAALRFLLDEEP
jgi:predicted alpha/beta superfamily hydrolase